MNLLAVAENSIEIVKVPLEDFILANPIVSIVIGVLVLITIVRLFHR